VTTDSSKHTSSAFEGDFSPGEVLIGRYRIVALIGEGGMGQVYLADDLVLGQSVAVKFLPPRIAESEGGLERFRGEVRHAREVTHPNVARVHDIGEVDGRHFLTMEFVDGEDLASLIRRIGRLPREKAAVIAQEICAGLAEAHRKGVLHRDLKPANVMLDGEGHVRLTDFGLAVAAEASHDAALAGTPRYMAPEQLAGLPATIESEVYSLGLLLHELYTGKPALAGSTVDQLRREHEEKGPSSASEMLPDIDPSVEAMLARCLERDPTRRPGSVLDVARALPGGDPLAAALAAGETPAPEVVAAADSGALLQPRTAAGMLAAATLLLVLLILGKGWLRESRGLSYGRPAGYLRERAREITRELAGEEVLAHELHWYAYDEGVEGVATDGPHPLVHHSRFGPESIVPYGQVASPTDPAPGPGSVHIVLDAEGLLVRWSREPLPREEAGAASAAVDWEPLLELAGLEPGALEPVEPARLPEVFATGRAAWRVGPPAQEPAEELRVEAASLDGRVAQFGWTHGGTALGTSTAHTRAPGGMAYFQMFMFAAAGLLAWRNLRQGRAYVRGALEVGLFLLATHLVLALGRAQPSSLLDFGVYMYSYLSYALHLGVFVALLYLALEPFARRHWPKPLITWNRLLEGGMRDPAVGREVLIGLLVAPAVVIVGTALQMGLVALGLQPDGNTFLLPLLGLEGPLQMLSHVLHQAGDGVLFSGLQVFLLFLLRSWIPSAKLASGLWLIGMTALISPLNSVGVLVVFLSCVLWLLSREGFLATATMMFAYLVLLGVALTLQPREWHFSSSLALLAVFALLGIAAYRVAVGPSPPGARS